MKSVIETLGLKTNYTIQRLKVDRSEALDLGTPLAPKEENRIPRIARAELEFAYLMDGTTFNSVNNSVELIMSAEHAVVAKNEEVQKYFDDFLFKQIGRVGNPKSWEDLLTLLFRYQFIYGDVLIERIFNENETRIVDLDIIDPKRHEIARGVHERALVDEFGRPVGYVIQVNQYTSQVTVSKRVTPPKGVQLHHHEYFLPPESIAHFKLYEIGDGLQGLGIIEPVYKNILRKLNLQKAQGDAAFRHSTPILWAEVGDDSHHPTPQVVEDMLKKLRKVRTNYNISLPHFVKLHMLESKQSTTILEHLRYLENQEVTGFGVPKAFATAEGEATNRATLNVQSDLFELSLQDIANRLSTSIRKFIFAPIAALEGFDEVPKLIWGPIGIDRKERRAELALELFKAGILSVPEARGIMKDLHIFDGDPNELPPIPEVGNEIGRPKNPEFDTPKESEQ